MNKVTTGMAKLDELLGGGLPQKTAILLSGGAGTGKTLIALNYLIEGAEKNEKCCYITLNEKKDELLRACQGIKKLEKIQKHIDKNLIIEQVSMGEHTTVENFAKIFQEYPQADRLAIDNINKLLIHAENKREYRIRLAQLIAYAKEKINSTLLICETEKDSIDTGNGEAFESDGIIHLSISELEENPKRTLEITKMRYTPIQPKIRHELVINGKELKLSDTRIL